MEAAERRVKALEMRKQGCTYRQIAAALGVDLKQAHGYVSDYLKMLAEEAKESAEELRAIEIAKLDKAERECWKRLRAASDADAAKLVGKNPQRIYGRNDKERREKTCVRGKNRRFVLSPYR